MNKVLRKNKDILVIIVVIVYCLLLWWPTRNLAYHWDSAGYVINAARDFTEKNFSTLIPDVGLIFAHPPLFTMGLALWWKLLGNSFLTSHLFVLPYLPILMISTYFLGKKIKNWETGVATAFLTGTTAIVVSEYGLVYLDMPLAALTTLALALWFGKKYILAGFILGLAIWFKIPAILVLPAMGIKFFLDKKIRKKWQFYFGLWLPVVFLVLWLFYHYSVRGWFLFSPDRSSPRPKNITQFVESFIFVCKYFFVTQNKWIISLWGLSSALWLFLNNKLKKIMNKNFITLLVLLTTGIFFYTWAGEFALRYGIFMLPVFYLIIILLWQKTTKNKYVFWAAIVIAVVFLVRKWHPKIPLTSKYEFRASEDMSYLDFIKIGKDAAQFLEINYPNALIYGSFPEAYQITQPYQGYVKKALNFSECKDFQLEDRQQILYLHPYSPGQYFCRVLLDKVATQHITRFESKGKWVELYLVTASKSAQLKK